jgi:hypothetical protein
MSLDDILVTTRDWELHRVDVALWKEGGRHGDGRW